MFALTCIGWLMFREQDAHYLIQHFQLTQVSQISAKFDYFCPLTALEPLILLGGACSAPLCADLGC